MNFPISQKWKVAQGGVLVQRGRNRSISGNLPISCLLKTVPLCPPAFFIDLMANGKIVEMVS